MIAELKALYQETAAKKRAELDAALERGEVGDPVSIGISIAISVALSAGSYLIATALAPKPPRQQQGKMSGTLQLMNSEQGIFIPEVYGAGPTVTLVTGTDPTYQNLTNTTDGASGAITKTSGAANSYNAGASHNVAVTASDAFLKVTRGTGHATAGFFDTDSPTGSGTQATGCVWGIAWSPDGTLYGVINGLGSVLNAVSVAGDVFHIELRSGRFHLYKGSAELTMSRPQPTIVFPLHLGVIMYSAGAGVSAAKIQVGGDIGDPPNAGRGGIKLPAIIVWTSGIRKNVSVTSVPVQGGKGGSRTTQTVENITYDIDLGEMYCRGPVTLLRAYANADVIIDQYDQSANPTGVYNPAIPPDTAYNPHIPPDPTTSYTTPFNRVDGSITFDPDGVGTGTIQGGGSSFAIYPGNATQDPDPTIEADIDALHGAGSTPAYRNHSLIRYTAFSLSRWSGIVPNKNAVWEHSTLKTLDTIFGSLCARSSLISGDYDWTGLVAIKPRGMLIAGRLFQSAEVIDSPEIQLAYNYFSTEVEGQIVGFAEGDEPVLEIDDTEVGWLDGESDVPDIIPEVESILASEILLPRQVDVKFIDVDNEWEPNTQSAKRQITDGVSTELLEVQLALLTEEARAIAQRKLYRDYVAGTIHKFTLPWTYLYIHPGYRIVITRAEGFTHTLRLTSFEGGIGVLNCEGVALEPSIFTQPAVGTITPGYQPPQSIPAMTIISLLDTPLLRDEDDGKVGWYVVGTPRTGPNQAWQGFVLLMFKNNEWQVKANSQLPGTVGTIVSVTALSTDPDVIDTVGEIVVDLYGTVQTLSSVTEDDIEGGANLALANEMLFNFADAVQVADFANRWTLSTLLNGQNDTEHLIADVTAGDRFVLINEAVKFVPMDIEDINVEYDYRAVTVGQSLDDAATIPAVWTGASTAPQQMSDALVTKDANDHWLIQAQGNPRPSEEPATYEVLFGLTADWSDEAANTVLTLPMVTGTSQAALLASETGEWNEESETFDLTSHAFKNNVASFTNDAGGSVGFTSIQAIEETFQRFDFEMAHGVISGGDDIPNLSDGAFGTGFLVTLHNRADAAGPYATPAAVDCPLSVEWVLPADYYDTYPIGTVQAVFRSFAATLKTIEGVDPGYNPFDQTAAAAGQILDGTEIFPQFRRGHRYTFLLNGQEVAIYEDYKPAGGNRHIIKVSLGDTIPFPLRLSGFLPSNTFVGSDFYLRSANFSGAIYPSTILSKADQEEAYGSVQTELNLLLRQVSRYPGVKGAPLYLTVP